MKPTSSSATHRIFTAPKTKKKWINFAATRCRVRTKSTTVMKCMMPEEKRTKRTLRLPVTFCNSYYSQNNEDWHPNLECPRKTRVTLHIPSSNMKNIRNNTHNSPGSFLICNALHGGTSCTNVYFPGEWWNIIDTTAMMPWYQYTHSSYMNRT